MDDDWGYPHDSGNLDMFNVANFQVADQSRFYMIPPHKKISTVVECVFWPGKTKQGH